MQENKKESCDSSNNKCCSCCCGVKKLIGVVLLISFIFMFGYIVGKGYCPFASNQTCPMMKK